MVADANEHLKPNTAFGALMMTATTTGKIFYHGSYDQLEAGTVMKGRGEAYVAAWIDSGFYSILESYRPEHCLAHKDAVFMVDDIDDIDNVGGPIDWVLELIPEGVVSKHDVNWSTEISCLISDGHDIDSPEVRHAAEQYWAGTAHKNESVWEYLAESAKVVKAYELDDADNGLSLFF
jgi:hypothetical protein